VDWRCGLEAATLTHETAEVSLTDTALICGFEIRADGVVRELRTADIGAALHSDDGVTWLHFSLANARAVSFLAHSPRVPACLRALLEVRDSRPRVEIAEGGLLFVMTDLSFEHSRETSEVAALWAHATPRLVISARSHPLRSTDLLRQRLREGLRVASGIELIVRMLELRVRSLREYSDSLAEEVHDIEDRVLSGDVAEGRERLGRVRRECARIHRHFGRDRTALQKVVTRAPASMSPAEVEDLKEVVEEFTFLLDEVQHLYERAKLLQEELAARLAEKTGTRLYVLSVLSAVVLPMTFVTGIFGMNVAGLPGTQEAASFWWTMLLVVAAGAVTLGVLRLRGLL